MICVCESAFYTILYKYLYICLRYMLMGGAVNLWMLHVGRFLTGVAGGMTAASIPVSRHGCRSKAAHVYVIYPHGFLNEFNLYVFMFMCVFCVLM